MRVTKVWSVSRDNWFRAAHSRWMRVSWIGHETSGSGLLVQGYLWISFSLLYINWFRTGGMGSHIHNCWWGMVPGCSVNSLFDPNSMFDWSTALAWTFPSSIYKYIILNFHSLPTCYFLSLSFILQLLNHVSVKVFLGWFWKNMNMFQNHVRLISFFPMQINKYYDLSEIKESVIFEVLPSLGKRPRLRAKLSLQHTSSLGSCQVSPLQMLLVWSGLTPNSSPLQMLLVCFAFDSSHFLEF